MRRNVKKKERRKVLDYYYNYSWCIINYSEKYRLLFMIHSYTWRKCGTLKPFSLLFLQCDQFFPSSFPRDIFPVFSPYILSFIFTIYFFLRFFSFVLIQFPVRKRMKRKDFNGFLIIIIHYLHYINTVFSILHLSPSLPISFPFLSLFYSILSLFILLSFSSLLILRIDLSHYSFLILLLFSLVIFPFFVPSILSSCFNLKYTISCSFLMKYEIELKILFFPFFLSLKRKEDRGEDIQKDSRIINWWCYPLSIQCNLITEPTCCYYNLQREPISSFCILSEPLSHSLLLST